MKEVTETTDSPEMLLSFLLGWLQGDGDSISVKPMRIDSTMVLLSQLVGLVQRRPELSFLEFRDGHLQLREELSADSQKEIVEYVRAKFNPEVTVYRRR